MKILIAPLNWGLGHASRCIPLIQKYIDDNNEVVIAGDGDSLLLLRKRFPLLRYIELPHLYLKYSKRNRQVLAMIRALPRIIIWSVRDHYALKRILKNEQFDRVISDNRFGLYINFIPTDKAGQISSKTETIYITHQVMIKMPKGLRWTERFVKACHHSIILKYSQCWIPDYAGEDNLSGDLSHHFILPRNAKFIGLLSRFPVKETYSSDISSQKEQYEVVAVLSGLEPQRTIFEKDIINRFSNREEHILIVRGLPNNPSTIITHSNITLVPYLDDKRLQQVLLEAKKIIARSGYSTLMDLKALNCFEKAELHPTPGQTEQEYLALLHNKQS